MLAVQTQNLTKIYNSVKVVDNVSFTIEKGKVFGFLGPNGAGKTTTIRMLLGLVKPNYGMAKILGCDIKNEYYKIAKDVAAIVENPTFFPYLNALQTLKVFSDYCDLEKTNSDLESILDKCGILSSAKKKVDTFSLGMKQRLGIAIALLNNPKIIFLDEPTNGLDPIGIVETRKLIRSLANQEGRTIFISSHLLNEVEQVCDEVAILHLGKIKVSGKVSELIQNKKVILFAKPIITALEVVNKFFPNANTGLNKDDKSINIDIDSADIPNLVEKLVHNKINIYQIFQSNQTLEDFFHQTIKE